MAAALLSGFTMTASGASGPHVRAVSQFQSELYSTSPGSFGTAALEINGPKQIFSVTINNLAGVVNGGSGSFGVFVSVGNSTNIPVFLIGPLSLQGTNDTWAMTYEGIGVAPTQISSSDITNLIGPVTNLIELSGLYLIIANPSTNNIVNAVLFTQIPPFTTKGGAPHYSRKSPLLTPAVAPNPKEKGWVKTIYTGSQGRSAFDIAAYNLPGGGSYSIFVENPPSSSIMSNIDTLVMSTNAVHTGTYSIDTHHGETIPFGCSTVRALSGRKIQIRDAFDEIHLEGTIP
ncbi:MAG TPA: hypothetical protein VMV72_06980 [Verrucomicrobiae bacterium]|nr:hypothetical protein [Verrucomicrobiae bacterium]